MNSDEPTKLKQARVTADMIKSYCGRGSQSLRGNSLPLPIEQMAGMAGSNRFPANVPDTPPSSPEELYI